MPSGKTNREEECEESNENNSPLLSTRIGGIGSENGKNDRHDFEEAPPATGGRRAPTIVNQ